jgi:hypothetical protein
MSDQVQDTKALFMELLAGMKPGDKLAMMQEIERDEQARIALEVAARQQRISERITTLNAELVGVSDSLKSFNETEKTQLHVSFDAETNTYVVKDAPAVQVRKGRTRQAVSSTTNALQTGGSRAKCQLNNNPFGKAVTIGTVFNSMADCARAAGLTDQQIYDFGGGHSGRAMDKAGIQYTVLS